MRGYILLPNIIIFIKSGRIINAYETLVGKSETKRQIGRLRCE
jgi:hypothetical protein